MAYFNKFEVEYYLDAILINETPLSIGAGKNTLGYSDNPIVKLRMEEPYIPASSIKGVLRSEAERYVRSVYGNKERVCNIFSNEELEDKNNKKENYKPCIICNIFGGPTIASIVYIENATLDNKEGKLIESIRKVSIHRVTGAQYSGRLYDLEYLVPNLRFKWGMRFFNLDLLKEGKENEIVNYLLNKFVKLGFVIGGRKSIGFGRVRIESFKLHKYTLDKGVLKIEDSKDITEEYKKRIRL